MNKRHVVDESERNITEQILLGMELINRIDNMTALEARDLNQSVSNLLLAISSSIIIMSIIPQIST